MNLIKLIEEAAQKYADRLVLVSDDRRINYRELNNNANALAHLLKTLGLNKGDKAVIMLPNIPEFVYAYFAAIKLGAVAVPVNSASTASELAYLLENSDAKVLIGMESSRKRFEEIKGSLSLCRNLITVDFPDESSPFRKALAQGPFTNPAVTVSPEDPAVIIYTAGLTGRPLGAVLTHGNLTSQSFLLRDILHRDENDKGLGLIPLFHAFGASVNMLSVIRVGASIVMIDRFTMDTIFSAIAREKITFIAAVPRLYLGMMFHADAAKYDISSLSLCVTGGAPMPADFVPAFEKQFGVKILEGYGLTEASPVCSFNRQEMKHKPGSIGMALPDVQIKIIDDEGNELPRGEVGELIVSGKNVMQGYYKDDAATASVIKNGWLYTGDLGRMDEDGDIFLTGRKKRMIITSGFNVYPREVENVLNLHPAVKFSRVSAKEDLMRGEIVRAEIVRKAGAEADDKEILKHCRIYLSPYKVPREIEFVEKIED